MKHRRMSTPRKSKISISSGRSALSLPRCWLARYSIVTSTIAANWRVTSATRRARFRAETWPMTKGSARPAKGRTTGIELAWLWLRYQPDSDLSVWFRARVGAFKGRRRRIAIVALARKLLVALWRYLETGLVPRGAVLKGGGTNTKYR